METLRQRQDISTFIKIISEEKGIHDYTITSVSTNEKGEGFLAQFFMVTIKDTVSNKQLDVAIKAAFIDDQVRKILPIRWAFENEVYFYSEVYPLFKKFERHHGICEDVEYVPKCLKVSIEEHSEMLALENLKVSGFEIFDKTCFLDHDHISLIFETYGRFHASSFALRDQQPEVYEKLKTENGKKLVDMRLIDWQ
ncbi:EcKinase domain containing protein, partial [Asbolus verrucosus]